MSSKYSIQPLRDLPPDRLMARKRHLFAEIARERESRSTVTRLRLTRPRIAALAGVCLCLAAALTALAVVQSRESSTQRIPAVGLHSSQHPTKVGRQASTRNDCQPVTVFPQPPVGFDPTTATAAQLKEYGFPPRPPGDPSDPTVQAALQAWLKTMAARKASVPPNPICGTVTHHPGNHAR